MARPRCETCTLQTTLCGYAGALREKRDGDSVASEAYFATAGPDPADTDDIMSKLTEQAAALEAATADQDLDAFMAAIDASKVGLDSLLGMLVSSAGGLASSFGEAASSITAELDAERIDEAMDAIDANCEGHLPGADGECTAPEQWRVYGEQVLGEIIGNYPEIAVPPQAA